MDYTVRLRDMLEYMSDAELALQPGDITQQEGKRWQNMRLRSADLTGKAMTTEGTPVDATELATQLRTCGLVRTVTECGCRRLDDSYSALLESFATILNATGVVRDTW